MSYNGLMAANGSINVTVVDGTTYTGLYAADGTMNVIEATGTVYLGATHPCGARYVALSPGTLVPVDAPNGAMYVSQATAAPSTNSGQPVTVVTGVLT